MAAQIWVNTGRLIFTCFKLIPAGDAGRYAAWLPTGVNLARESATNLI